MFGLNRTILSNDNGHYARHCEENVVYISDIALRFRFGTEQHLNGTSEVHRYIDGRSRSHFQCLSPRR